MLSSIYSSEEIDRVERSKVLLVGAGGIGCEILKNLVYSNFLHIEIIGTSFFIQFIPFFPSFFLLQCLLLSFFLLLFLLLLLCL